LRFCVHNEIPYSHNLRSASVLRYGVKDYVRNAKGGTIGSALG